ncbi:MAG: sarcosine oxidase subunit gamma [Hyphomicrobiaceae bacterium]
MPPAVRFSLRMDAALASTSGQPGGFDLTQPINRLNITVADDTNTGLSARLGPDEWLLITHDDDAGTVAEMLAHDLGERTHTLVDISHRNIALEVIGDAAADVINSGCPLDLGDKAFPVGTATRTLFAKSEIVLMRIADPDQRPLFRIECWRSFGRYLHAQLSNAAALIGAHR